MTKGSRISYVAFLRGINVGGRKPIKMAELSAAFVALNFQSIRTVLASGNVLFSAPKSATDSLARAIESKIKSAVGHEVGVIVRSIDEIRALADAEPFKKVKVTPNTRLYVTFLAEKPKTTLKIPWETKDKEFGIVRSTENELCSVVTLSPQHQTTEAMLILEKEFGRKITTRNWNTIEKILKAAGD